MQAWKPLSKLFDYILMVDRSITDPTISAEIKYEEKEDATYGIKLPYLEITLES